MTDQVYTQAHYNTRPSRSTRNPNDGIYNSGGEQMIVNVTETDEGYAGVLNIGVFEG